MRIPGALVALACLAAMTAAPTRADAQTRTITCESRDDDRRDCFISGLDQSSVSLDRQLSKSECEKGRSWGTSRDNIWVSRGCRGSFSYRTRSGSGSGYASGGSGTVTCESRGDARKECFVAGLDPESVTMDELLSETVCVRGRNWDAENGMIWVKSGCRARFAYLTKAGGSGGYGGVSGGSGTVTCESRGDARKECFVAGLDPESVTMDELLSETVCMRGRNWDAQDGMIWVKGGCRARFAYLTKAGGSGGYGGGASKSAMRDACIDRASREWAVTRENIEVTGTNRLDGGEYEVLIQTKRTKGSCYVSSSGRVQRISTW